MKTFGTFGLFRYVLAVAVVIAHVGPDLDYLGKYAVFAFFMLSGYVVSFILGEHYLKVEGGLLKYAANRFLRIFPLYWVLVALVVVEIALFPDAMRELNDDIRLPQTAVSWLANITSIGMTSLTGEFSKFRLVGPAWSTGMECMYWTVIPALLLWPRLRQAVLVLALGFAATLTWLLFTQYQPLWFDLHFSSVWAASLPFVLGLYLYRRPAPLPRAVGIGAMIVYAAMTVYSVRLFENPNVTGFYFSIPLDMAVIGYLSGVELRSLPAVVRRIDKGLGALTYPLFLLHMPLAGLVHALRPALVLNSWEFCLTTIAVSMVAAVIAHGLVEMPLEKLRARLRG